MTGISKKDKETLRYLKQNAEYCFNIGLPVKRYIQELEKQYAQLEELLQAEQESKNELLKGEDRW